MPDDLLDRFRRHDRVALARLLSQAARGEGAARQGTLRVARQHRHRLSAAPNHLDQFADERALPDAGAAGDGDNAALLGRRPEANENVGDALAAGSAAEEAR